MKFVKFKTTTKSREGEKKKLHPNWLKERVYIFLGHKERVYIQTVFPPFYSFFGSQRMELRSYFKDIVYLF